jgi:hypothetical protein
MRDVRVWVFLVVGVVGACALAMDVRAQQQPVERGIETWELYRRSNMVVTVIQTPAVCVYIANDSYTINGRAVALTVVPRTQLPAGRGCTE